MKKRISVAPMMGQTDRHFRYMISLIAKDVRLYTPMIHAEAIVNSSNQFIKRENGNQKKVGIQIAGNDPDIVARAATIIEKHNYNEINLNIGSQRTGSELFSWSSINETTTRCCRYYRKT